MMSPNKPKGVSRSLKLMNRMITLKSIINSTFHDRYSSDCKQKKVKHDYVRECNDDFCW
jgi:hypothetical protein